VIGRVYRKLRDFAQLKYLTQNEMESAPLRALFASRHQVIVGMYSYGCFDPYRIPARTRIGRYCSFAKTARVIDANHPMGALTTHPYLYDASFGLIPTTQIDPPRMVIEDDVWIGQNAVITPGCKLIGRGAVIGAGAVVTRDVPAYAIVVGNPASIKRHRFTPEIIAMLEQSRWWEMDKAELKRRVDLHPLLITDAAALGEAGLAKAIGPGKAS
jgi:virginiamycin A acetyltransferase